MAKVFIEETTLTAIGDAIRGKTGKTDLIDPANMSTEIAGIEAGGGGSDEIPDIVITDSAAYACSGLLASAFIQNYPTKVTTKDLTNIANMFYNSTLTHIPFDINVRLGSATTNMFYNCRELVTSPSVDCKHTTYGEMDSMYYNCVSLVNISPVTNAYPASINNLFYNCRSLQAIPDDFFDTWDFSRLLTYTYANIGSLFPHCYKLRKIPSSLFEKLSPGWTSNSAWYSPYYNLVYFCYALDELTDVPLPAESTTLTTNCFQDPVSYASHLKRFTFMTNEDGTPKVRPWKSQLLDFSNFVGYLYDKDTFLNNTGLPATTYVTDDASYQAFKNDPDWFTCDVAYSRYNHDSAVETINSLPDTSVYIASAGGTNTIKFKGEAGSKTDGGAINTLTEEEIAVATAKGWTVTFG